MIFNDLNPKCEFLLDNYGLSGVINLVEEWFGLPQIDNHPKKRHYCGKTAYMYKRKRWWCDRHIPGDHETHGDFNGYTVPILKKTPTVVMPAVRKDPPARPAKV